MFCITYCSFDMEKKHMLKSPSRENPFRSCKSPIKITSSSKTRRKLSDHGFNISCMDSKEKKKIIRRSGGGGGMYIVRIKISYL